MEGTDLVTTEKNTGALPKQVGWAQKACAWAGLTQPLCFSHLPAWLRFCGMGLSELSHERLWILRKGEMVLKWVTHIPLVQPGTPPDTLGVMM